MGVNRGLSPIYREKAMKNLPLFASVAALSLLGGCWDNSGPEVNITTINSDEAAELPAPDANLVEPANTVAANTVEAARPALNLAPDELTVVLDSGSARHVSFGLARDVAVPMVAAALGKPSDVGRNDECGQGPMETVDF